MFNLKTGIFGLTLACTHLLFGVRAEVDFGDIIWKVSCEVVGSKVPFANIACDEMRKVLEIDPEAAEPVDIAVIPHGQCQNVQLSLERITEVCAPAGRLYYHLAHTWWYGCYDFETRDGNTVECCQFKYGSNGLDQYPGKFPHHFCNDIAEEGLVNSDVSDHYNMDWISDPQYYRHQTEMAVTCGAELEEVDVEKKYSDECDHSILHFQRAIETKNDNNAHRFIKFNDGSCEIWPSKGGDRWTEEECSF